jgi:hypothetical protein
MRIESKVVEGEVTERADPEEKIKQVRTKTPADWMSKGVAYESLMRAKRGTPVRSIKRQVIEDDRSDMESKNLIEQQRLSYYNFGLSSYSREGVQKVADLDLDADDVVLFGSLTEAEMKLDEWAAILIKDEEGKKLTPEEEKTAEEYIELGIANTDDLLDFGILQKNLILSPRTPL